VSISSIYQGLIQSDLRNYKSKLIEDKFRDKIIQIKNNVKKEAEPPLQYRKAEFTNFKHNTPQYFKNHIEETNLNSGRNIQRNALSINESYEDLYYINNDNKDVEKYAVASFRYNKTDKPTEKIIPISYNSGVKASFTPEITLYKKSTSYRNVCVKFEF